MKYIIKAESIKDTESRVYATVTDENENFIISLDEYTPDPTILINKVRKLLLYANPSAEFSIYINGKNTTIPLED